MVGRVEWLVGLKSERDASAPPARAPLLGAVLGGRLELVAALSATHYRAIQRPLDRPVAVEVLEPRQADAATRERFLREAALAARLSHPNAQAVYDYGQTEEGACFVARELLEGQTLEQRLLAQERLAWPRALWLGAQVARALRAAHAQNLVHGALSPASVLLRPDGHCGEEVKVLGFGEAIGPDAMPYMAPELASGPATPRSDVYALGAVVFRAISGRTPATEQRLAGGPSRPEARGQLELYALPTAPDAVAALVTKCLEKDPAARFCDADELLDALGRLTDSRGVAGGMVDSLPWPGHEAASAPAPALRATPSASLGRLSTPPRGARRPVRRLEGCLSDDRSVPRGDPWRILVRFATLAALGGLLWLIILAVASLARQ